MDPIGGHEIGRLDEPQCDQVLALITSPIPHDADRAHGDQDGKRLPDLAVPVRGPDLVNDDLVDVLKQRHALGCHLADNADGQPRPGERMPPDDFTGQAKVLACGPHFVLEEVAERLDQLEIKLLG